MKFEDIPDPAEVFDCFWALAAVAPDPGGLLVFCGELDADGMALAAATNIAGAASLGVNANPDSVKRALREGVCDFMVNSLDEALRILKNEVRRKQPVSVGLVGNPESVVAEMIERGVQPDLVLPDRTGSAQFIGRGAQVLQGAIFDNWIEVVWGVEKEPATWLPRVDAVAIESLGDLSDSRVKWLRIAPRYLWKQFSRRRYVRMSAAELGRFRALLQEKIAVPVSIQSG
jgi:hypothetical protein